MESIPLSLYVHFPWCLRKCPYCDFNSYNLPTTMQKTVPLYVEKLLADIEADAKKIDKRKLNSIYFGGGTPSLLPSKAIKKIINRSKKLFSFADDIEITLEANPGTIDLTSCESFKDAGINRISLGVQSFDDEKLKTIGRVHNAKQAKDAITAIKKAKFSNFNIDLIFGLPGQKIDEALKDLRIALNFKPPHLSWYQLTLEPNTKFAKQKPVLPQIEELWEIQQLGQDLLLQNSLLQYEVSAYSKFDYECKHNINYWQYGDYLGIGAGAHGKITLKNHQVKRYWKINNPKKYLQKQNSFIANEKLVTVKKRPFEFMLNALRLYWPITNALFYERTGIKIDAIKKELLQSQKMDLIEINHDSFVTTKKGKDFLNDLLISYI